ncbi:MAG: hypothetical protein AA908_04390 [Chlorobi bacterium NICIL-2]|nr:MAG: hypothetical protein AA908_04390 [Chlorobi bacterium NICIL-2]
MALAAELRERLLSTHAADWAVDSDAEAYRYCRQIAFGHYENFPVAQLALGKKRDDIAAIYAFARLADDIADESSRPAMEKRALLDMLERWLFDPPMQHPIMRALSRTIVRNQLPRDPFRRLLDAFRFDATLEPFPTEEAVLAYCSNSAAPIGELMLRLEREWNERTAPHSDAFCAGLQVLNFWQDIGCDLQRGRSTIPHEWIGGQPLTWAELSGSADLRTMIAGRFDRMVGRLLPAGIALSQAVRSKRLRLQVRATFAAASVVWRACQRRGERFSRRPRLRWWHIPVILGATLIAPGTS